jgi:RND superfamily putative drug exporter
LVWIFQYGALERPLNFVSQGALEVTAPILLFAAAFALSTDYGIFLLARIKEERDRGASDSDAIAAGQERTGRQITAAAILFCVAVGSFATSSVIGVKETTLGIALAVLIDATLIRALLMPALMHLLASWNWWSPRPLARLYTRIGVKESSITRTSPDFARFGNAD